MVVRPSLFFALVALAFCLSASSPFAEAVSPVANGQIVFLSSRDSDAEQIYVMNADGTQQVALTRDGYRHFYPSWSPDGRKILFQRFTHDLFGRFRPAEFTPGPYDEAGPGIFVMNADGSGQRKLADATTGAWPVWSPDGSQIAFHRRGDVFVINADGSGDTKLTDGLPIGDQLTWSPDGSQIAFVTSQNGGHDIYATNVDGSGQTRLMQAGHALEIVSFGGIDWSPDGSQIAFVAGASVLDMDIHVVNVDGSCQRKLTDIHGTTGYPSWSPDGSQITFSAGGEGLMLVSADGKRLTNVTNRSAGALPFAWSPDGSQIAFASISGIYAINTDGSNERRLTNRNDYWPDWQALLSSSPLAGAKDEGSRPGLSWLLWAGAATIAAVIVIGGIGLVVKRRRQ